MVNDTVLCSIRSLVEYIEDTEEDNTRIYEDAVTVREWLDEA